MSAEPVPSVTIDRLSQYLRWGFWITLSSYALVLGLSAIRPEPALRPPLRSAALGLFGTLALIAVLVISRALLKRGRLRPALRLLTSGGLLVAVLYVVSDPSLLVQTIFYPIMAVLLALPHLERALLRRLAYAAFACGVLLTVLAQWVNLFQTPVTPSFARQWYNLVAIPGSAGIILLLVWQVHQYLNDALDEARQAHAETESARAALEVQVETRTAELHATVAALREESVRQQALVAELAEQRATLRSLSVPILPLSASTLVVPLIGALDAERLELLSATVLQAAQQRGARRVLLDVTGIPIIDRELADGLIRIIQAGRLLGANVVLIGVRPDVAEGLIATGVDVRSLATAPDLASAFAASAA